MIETGTGCLIWLYPEGGPRVGEYMYRECRETRGVHRSTTFLQVYRNIRQKECSEGLVREIALSSLYECIFRYGNRSDKSFSLQCACSRLIL